jgi:dolichol-phosphate mannosyltransferase
LTTISDPTGLMRPTGEGAWIALPTYNERENLPAVLAAIRQSVPAVHVLIVDDNSPDGTGQLANELALADDRVKVLHRPGKEGLGAAYREAFRHLLGEPGCEVIVQMDCDLSHDPRQLPDLLAAVAAADLVLGSRYVAGGSTPGWSWKRRVVSRGGSLFARSVLGLPYRDLTGGFKAWRSSMLRSVDAAGGYANGYGFQIETTWRAHQLGGVVREVPITFRDRVAGDSKMSAGIMWEAIRMVLELRGQRLPRLRRS